MKSITFWDMMPCSPFSFNRRFGGTYRLHLQGACHLLARWFAEPFFGYTFPPFYLCHTFGRKPGGPQNRRGCCGEGKISTSSGI
jgi:hypothetical protein